MQRVEMVKKRTEMKLTCCHRTPRKVAEALGLTMILVHLYKRNRLEHGRDIEHRWYSWLSLMGP